MNNREFMNHLFFRGDTNRPALKLKDKEISYRELSEQIEAWEGRLFEYGIPPGSLVVLQLPGSFTLLYLMFALWKRGCRIAMMDYRLKPSETDDLNLLCEPNFRIHASDSRTSFSFKETLEVTVDPVLSMGSDSNPSEHLLVQFTSGSTGRSKVVGRTAQDLLEDIDRVVMADDSISGTDRVLVLSSISHTYGLLTAILPTLRQGGTLVFCTTPQPQDVLSTLHSENVTIIVGVPFHYELLANSTSDERPWSSIRSALSAGETLNPSTIDRFREKYGVYIGQVYGMTETGIISADFTGQFPGSAGRLLKGMALEIREGEIFIRMKANPYLLSEAGGRFENNWLRTQDIGEMFETDQVLTIRGRTGSIAVIGGLKVNFLEIEQVLVKHDAVRAAIVNNSTSGRIEAYVELKESISSDNLMLWCKDRLADYKIPSLFHFVDTVPRTVTGKLSRNSQILSGLQPISTYRKEG